jgi:hypothetical protein
MEKLYRVVELTTEGWNLVNETDTRLTKEKASLRYQKLLDEGYSPDRLKIIREQ